jgi:glycine hydroxymethyltransferase
MTSFSKKLYMLDSKVFDLIKEEKQRQENSIQLIASENYASENVMNAQGSILTNKYAEGYPGRRYYSGCDIIDKVENVCRNRAKSLFRCEFANVQPHSGSQANEAVYLSLLNPGDSILGLKLDHGGHLTHGFNKNFSGKIYKTYFYSLKNGNYLIDYHKVRKLAIKYKPKLIIAGYSAYSKIINWKIFKLIAKEVNAYLLADISHISGLICSNLYPSPIKIVDIITSTTHKTLRGPRGGIIMSNDRNIYIKINSGVFPGTQGGPLMHVIAAKAVAFKEAYSKEFIFYQKKLLKNSKIFSLLMIKKNFEIISGITDNHLFLLNLHNKNTTGKKVEDNLYQCNIIVNKNMVPNDKKNASLTSGIRIGSPSITSRGFKSNEILIISNWICDIIDNYDNNILLKKIKIEVKKMCKLFPIYK